MVESAVQGAVPEGTSAEEIKVMVEAAVGAASQDAITADQVRTLVAEAVAESATEGPDPLSADEVRQIVSAAVSALPTPEARVVTKEVKVTEVKEVQIPGKKYVTDPTTNKVIPAPEYGGTIIRLQTNQPPHTDTYFTHHAANGTDGVTESLAHADWGIDRSVFDHKKRPTPLWVMKGQLATGWVQNDPLTYTINIRDDVYWHNKAPMDGRKMTAQDVAWNFQRYLHLGDEYADQEGPCCTFKSVKWESVTATDDNTVVFKLEEPNIDTLTILFTSYSPHILPPEVVQEHGDIQDWRNLVGTGPFMLTDWVDGSSMTWEKNPDYWGTDEKFPENQLPYADATRALIMKDEATRIAAMRTGKGDYMGWLANSAISTTDQAEALVKTNPDISLIPYAYRSTTSTAFDVDKPPFDDVRVRRAMQMALDLDTINTIYFKGWATVEPMGQIGTGAIEYVTPFDQWPTLASLSIIAGKPRCFSTISGSGQSSHPTTWVELTMRCVSKLTGPPNPMPQANTDDCTISVLLAASMRSILLSAWSARSVWCWMCLMTRPAGVARARPNWVPPMSMARIIVWLQMAIVCGARAGQ
ncbi:MAG: ABC transporter substrate-binding protein [Rhodospirillales bacterium]|nr:ABC transporter substrate-binding protein [Rhodospirillales bacterium]